MFYFYTDKIRGQGGAWGERVITKVQGKSKFEKCVNSERISHANKITDKVVITNNYVRKVDHLSKKSACKY